MKRQEESIGGGNLDEFRIIVFSVLVYRIVVECCFRDRQEQGAPSIGGAKFCRPRGLGEAIEDYINYPIFSWQMHIVLNSS